MQDLIRTVPLKSSRGNYNVIIETPGGNRNKYSYDEKLNIFMLKKELPSGFTFPYDFGFLPNTKGEDGGPLDVLLIADEPSFTGCLIEARIIGVILATQIENGKDKIRNDRFIAVPAVEGDTHDSIHSLEDLSEIQLSSLEHFFIAYNESEGKKLNILGRKDAAKAENIISQFTIDSSNK